LVKDKQRHIAYLKELVKIIITDKRKEMPQLDQEQELENLTGILKEDKEKQWEGKCNRELATYKQLHQAKVHRLADGMISRFALDRASTAVHACLVAWHQLVIDNATISEFSSWQHQH